MKIETLEVAGHPGYYARSDGVIIGKRGKPLVGHIDRCGYHEVLFSENGKLLQFRTHRLILETFSPRADMKLLDVNHKNGDKADNRLENLEWCTRSENVIHAYRNNLEKKYIGTKHHRHVLTKEILHDIRTNCRPGHTGFGFAVFARKYGVNYSTIARAYRGESYYED